LLKNLSVTPSKESSVLEINYSSEDPNFATIVANSFAETYQLTSTQLKVAPAQQAAGYFGQQVKTLRDDLEQAQSKLSEYQQEKGITNPEQTLDIENIRLNELSSQLSMVQAASIDSQSRNANAKRSTLDSPDIASSPTIQVLKADSARADAKLAQVAQRLGKNHPAYKSAESDAIKVRSQLHEEAQRLSNSIGNSASINQQRESQLRTQVEMQKKKVLGLNRLRDEMGILQKDVEVAKRAMDAVTQRFSQTSIEGQSNQSDIAILNPAIAPGSPSSPKVLLNIVLGAFVGLVLGIGFGLLAELLDRRVRGRDDISVLLGVPVFAVIEGSSKKMSENLLLGQSRKLLSSN
jgi:polysaccharide biosynthesis transport protein